ncbi:MULTISPECIES: lactonase family protein [Streptomyces]|uniref:Lactonase family protein n=1 Tax=Streptomyces solicathayae TaxID=3081768 RepID=A0ABZ0M310_9ACTN|nr:lactonase family protein [Streptomyces sp. HUAS YS2]WOX25895.1 lactonase family protein [Streptomyces sp. HUAS YS2]
MAEQGAVRAFIGSFTSAGGRGVTAASVDPETGALTETGATDAVADPSFLTLGRAGDGRPVLYAVSETDDGAVAAFDVTGPVPEPLGPPAPVRGSGPTHLCVAAGHVLTANYTSGGVSALPLGPDGTLLPSSDVLRHEGSGPVADRQSGPHAHQVLPAPGGRWILSVDLGTDSVRVCALDPATGVLRTHRETALRPGTGPRHLAFHPAGTHLYVLNELEPTVTVCRWDAVGGVVEPLGETSVLPEGPEGAREPSYPSTIVVAADGRFAFAAVRGDDSIAVLALTPSGDKAEPVATVPCGGHWPRDLTLEPASGRLYAANERSGDVTWFDVDRETGIPVRAGSLPAPAASCVVFA